MGWEKRVQKGFWSKQTVAVIGAGNWGTVLAVLASKNVEHVVLWCREDDLARQINATKAHPRLPKEFEISKNVLVTSDRERVKGASAVIWALPSAPTREVAREFSKYMDGSQILLHATKGVESDTLKRISVVLREELPCPRVGVISGPNLADEIARKQPAATLVASLYQEAIDAGQEIFSGDTFRVYGGRDVIGVEWAGTLKNVLAIAAGALDALNFGWNTRGMLMSRGLAEMVRFGVALGGEMETFLGLAGVGDLLATASSSLSRNYRVGYGLAKGSSMDEILKGLGSTAEGIRTATSVHQYAQKQGIYMPITAAVSELVSSKTTVKEVLQKLMARPPIME